MGGLAVFQKDRFFPHHLSGREAGSVSSGNICHFLQFSHWTQSSKVVEFHSADCWAWWWHDDCRICFTRLWLLSWFRETLGATTFGVNLPSNEDGISYVFPGKLFALMVGLLSVLNKQRNKNLCLFQFSPLCYLNSCTPTQNRWKC